MCFQELKLNNCGLGIEGGRMLAKSLTECHAAGAAAGRPFQLRVFIAGRNRLENDGARALADIFGKLGTLVEVAMPQNGINHDGIRALANAFKTNAGLRVLNLNDNTITPRGAASLAEAIEQLQDLREINLGDCLLKSGGAVLLAEAMQDQHQQLEILNLGFNEIGPNGGIPLVAAMQNKEKLQQIVLNGNMFGQECRDCIVEMLREVDKIDALGPLDEDDSDNEYEGNEDDEDDYEDVDEEDEEEDDEDDEDDREYGESETEEADDDDCDISAHAQSHQFSANSTLPIESANATTGGVSGFDNGLDSTVVEGDTAVETFCLTPHPTADMFNAIKDADVVAAFREYLSTVKPAEEYLLYTVFAVIKCSAISILCPAALNVATELYRDCFDYAIKAGRVQRVSTFFLTQLGLIRIEDPSFRLEYDVVACRAAVRNAIREGAVPSGVGSVFQLFFDRTC